MIREASPYGFDSLRSWILRLPWAESWEIGSRMSSGAVAVSQV